MDLLSLPAFLDSVTREGILDELRTVSGAPAAVYGTGVADSVHDNIRRVRRLVVSTRLREAMMGQLEDAKPKMERHFDIPLLHCEEPQFLHYRAGDFFVAHQDGNTALIRDDSRHRRVSVVLFLNDQSSEPRAGTYGGGELLLHGQYPDWTARQVAPAAAGALVAFRAETTHEVTPVTHGDRYTVVSWYR
jgi:SM-20-related protein